MGDKMKQVGRYFWNDEDGYSAQNHAFLLFTTPFALMWIIAAVLALCGFPINPVFIELMGIMDTPLYVVLAGIFSMNVANQFTKSKSEGKIVIEKKEVPSVNNETYEDDTENQQDTTYKY